MTLQHALFVARILTVAFIFSVGIFIFLSETVFGTPATPSTDSKVLFAGLGFTALLISIAMPRFVPAKGLETLILRQILRLAVAESCAIFALVIVTLEGPNTVSYLMFGAAMLVIALSWPSRGEFESAANRPPPPPPRPGVL